MEFADAPEPTDFDVRLRRSSGLRIVQVDIAMAITIPSQDIVAIYLAARILGRDAL